MSTLEVVLLGIIAVCIAFGAWRERCHDRERKDLYNRIMAVDLRDYSSINQGPPPKGGNIIKAGLKRSLNEMGRYGESQGL